MRLYIFETAVLTPRRTEQVRALEQAAAILRRQGRGKEADDLDAERAKRYPKTNGTR